MMYHLVYVTINLVNHNFYIGKHSTSNLTDGYLGSGYILKRAIKKYGKDKFYRLDFAFFGSEIEAFNMEKEVLNRLLGKDGCYNIGSGGEGGDNLSNNPNRIDIVRRMSECSTKKWQDEEFKARNNASRLKAMQTDEHRKLRSNMAIKLWKNQDYRTRVVKATATALNTEESKHKRSVVHRIKWEDKHYRSKMMKIFGSEEHRGKLSVATIRLFSERPDVLERINIARNAANRSPEHRFMASQRMKKEWKTNPKLITALTIGRMGDKNPTWGSKWMWNPNSKIVKKVQPNEINVLLNQGWELGRPRF